MKLFILLSLSAAHADSYRTYVPGYAYYYAITNYDREYGSGSRDNPWGNYEGSYGGNCTNFVSQAIMAGLEYDWRIDNVYDARYDFDIDADSSGYQWFWHGYGEPSVTRGSAFTGADALYTYARYNHSTYKGLHFEFVTSGSPGIREDDVRVGDIVFADWDRDGTIDHSMIVTGKSRWYWGNNEVRLTYQGSLDGAVGKTDIGLGDIDDGARIYVYRPTDYNPSGY